MAEAIPRGGERRWLGRARVAVLSGLVISAAACGDNNDSSQNRSQAEHHHVQPSSSISDLVDKGEEVDIAIVTDETGVFRFEPEEVPVSPEIAADGKIVVAVVDATGADHTVVSGPTGLLERHRQSAASGEHHDHAYGTLPGGEGVQRHIIGAGEREVIEIDLSPRAIEAGQVTFICDVPGGAHDEMAGRFVLNRALSDLRA